MIVRPFVTHSNALDTDLYLRLAPELFLKRPSPSASCGFFEIIRNFRNEGAMLDAYQAYAGYNVMQHQTREWIPQAAFAVAGSQVVTHYDGAELDLGGKWRAITLFGSLSDALGEVVSVLTDRAQLLRYAEKHDLSADPKWRAGKPAEGWWCRHCGRRHLYGIIPKRQLR